MAPLPYSISAAPAATKPMAAKTRWPVTSRSAIEANIKSAIIS